MRNTVSILIAIFCANVVYAQDIPDESEPVRQTFCVMLAKTAGATMKARSAGKDFQEVQNAYLPVIERAESSYGEVAAKMILTQLSLAYDDDEEAPQTYSRKAFTTCKILLKVNN